MTVDKVKAKIAKLLALALDQIGTPEGDVAARQAASMMERYDIDERDIEAAADSRKMIEKRVDFPKSIWQRWVAQAAAILTGCYVFNVRGRGSGMICYVGRTIDVEMAIYLTDSLRNQCLRDWRKYKRRIKSAGWTPDGDSYRKSWAVACGEKARSVLEAQRVAATEAALIPLSRTIVSRKFAEENNRLTSSTTKYRHSRAGERDGTNASFASGIGGGDARAPRALTN